MATHKCVDGRMSTKPTCWVFDGKGIPLCRVCGLCRSQKLKSYRPEILGSYTQADVDENIEPEPDVGTGFNWFGGMQGG